MCINVCTNAFLRLASFTKRVTSVDGSPPHWYPCILYTDAMRILLRLLLLYIPWITPRSFVLNLRRRYWDYFLPPDIIFLDGGWKRLYVYQTPQYVHHSWSMHYSMSIFSSSNDIISVMILNIALDNLDHRLVWTEAPVFFIAEFTFNIGPDIDSVKLKHQWGRIGSVVFILLPELRDRLAVVDSLFEQIWVQLSCRDFLVVTTRLLRWVRITVSCSNPMASIHAAASSLKWLYQGLVSSAMLRKMLLPAFVLQVDRWLFSSKRRVE